MQDRSRGVPARPDPALPFRSTDLPATEIEQRFAWARRQGHPHWLWPDVPIHAWRASLGELERITSRVLTDPGAAPRLTLPSDVSTGALGIAAFTSGLGPLLGHWVEEGMVEAPREAGRLLRLHLRHGRLRWERMRDGLHQAMEALGAAHVPVTVLKGMHTAQAYFPDPGTRPCADVDLLVTRDDLPAAVEALGAAGYLQIRCQDRPPRVELQPPDRPQQLRSLALTHADSGWAIDLHASLERDFFGIRRVCPLPEDPQEHLRWAGLHPAARTLPQPLLTAFLALHTSEGLHNLTLLRLVELVLVIRSDVEKGTLEWGALREHLEESGGLRFTAPALQLAERLVPGTLDPAFLGRVHAATPPRMARILSGLRPSSAQRLHGLSLDERFLWAVGPVEHLRRVLYMLWPGWMRRSAGRVARLYLERAWRLVRGRVSLTGGPPDSPS